MLRLGAADEGGGGVEGADAEVDTPGFRFIRKECRLVGQQGGWEKESQAQARARVEGVLAANLTTSLRKEWSRRGRRQSGRQAAGSSLRTGASTGLQISGRPRRTRRLHKPWAC